MKRHVSPRSDWYVGTAADAATSSADDERRARQR